MVWLPDAEKNLMLYLFVFTQSTNVTDTHTQTLHDGIYAALKHRAAKNANKYPKILLFCNDKGSGKVIRNPWGPDYHQKLIS